MQDMVSSEMRAAYESAAKFPTENHIGVHLFVVLFKLSR